MYSGVAETRSRSRRKAGGRGRDGRWLDARLEHLQVDLRQLLEVQGVDRGLLDGRADAHDAVALQVRKGTVPERRRQLAPQLGVLHQQRATPRRDLSLIHIYEPTRPY